MSLIWFVSSLSIMPDFFLLLATEPLSFFTSKVLCARDFVFRSSYSLKKRDASHIVCLVLVWLTLLYTYFRILFAAKGAKGDSKKARNTILLHGFQLLLCMLTYVRPMFKNALVFLLPRRHADIRFALYVFVQIIPRFVSPIVYGLRDQNFRKYMRRYLLCRIFYSNPRYVLFIHLVMNDMLQLTLSTLLHIISYTLNTFSVSSASSSSHPRRHGHLQHASQSGRHGGGVLRRYLPPVAPL
ncbi:hypothetical protein F7725_016462 [Dissostichus mawsoni]|uniref:G-protein coupled receptors family 1 profile domain-containing protein n=1 Tax=Dissostichus mawsoni TaxID=36200 RepID=A0A7J5Z3T5_DISMA|nr:hypothetical protein F7725_016462 [Dissostichus mawsoni]